MALTEAQIQRYSRHVLLPDVGGVGQARLLSATVAIEVGVGHDANVVALAYLAAAGVGRIVVTGDSGGTVTDAELAGSILYGAADVGSARLGVIARRVAVLNPDVAVEAEAEAEAEQPRSAPVRVHAARARDPVEALIHGGAAALETLLRLVKPG